MKKFYGICAGSMMQALNIAQQNDLTAMQAMSYISDAMDSNSPEFNMQANLLKIPEGIRLISHAPLMSNMAGAKRTRQFSINLLLAETKRCAKLGIDTVVFHPGSSEEENALDILVESIEQYKSTVTKWGLRPLKHLCVETMVGAGAQLCSTPEEIIKVVEATGIDFCLDTAHIYGAGYTMAEFLEPIKQAGFMDRLQVVHYNNTASILGSKKERHTILTEGVIPQDTLINPLDMISDDIPFILEQPKNSDVARSAKEIKMWLNS